MANNEMDLELEDFTYDDDGLPVPAPTTSHPVKSTTANNNNASNRRRKHARANDMVTSDVIVNHRLGADDPMEKHKHKPKIPGNRRYKDHSPVNDSLDNSSSTLPDVETILLDSGRFKDKPYVNVDSINGADKEDALYHPARRKSEPNNYFNTELSTCNDISDDEDGQVIDMNTDINPSRSRNKKLGNMSHDAVSTIKPKRENVRKSDRTSLKWAGDLQAIFDVDGKGFDVTLTATKIILAPVGSGSRRKSKRRMSGMFRSASRASLSKGSSLKLDSAGCEIIRLKDIYAVKVQRRPLNQHQSGEGICVGVTISTFVRKDANKLRVRNFCLQHPSESQCHQWVNRIKLVLSGFTYRPQKVKVFLQPYAGKRLGEGLYRSHIIPIFQAAGIEGDLLELKYNEHVKQEMIHMDLDSYDCVVCIGGDGTVRQVASGLLTRTQERDGISMKAGFSPVKSPIPLAIIPTGTTNQIAYSVMGTDDPITGALHTVLGHSHPVDICSVHSEERFVAWSFTSQYGFPASVLEFSDRYKALGANRLDAAFIKALTKPKLRPYKCDIEYIPSSTAELSHTNDRMVCFRGCDVCKSEGDRDSVTSDAVEDYDPLSQSGTSSTFMDLTEESPWRKCKGDYFQVGVLALPGRASFAPQGLSKFTHLADGCMDLILVKETDRKEFVRFLRRHGQSKNQMDLPFVETHRVKEVRFRPRLPTTWNYRDYDYSEIDYEMAKVQKRVRDKSKSLNELRLEDSDESSEEEDEVGGVNGGGGGRFNVGGERSQSMVPGVGTEDSDTPGTPDSQNSSIIKGHDRKLSTSNQQAVPARNPNRYRLTLTELDIIRRRNKQAKKDKKRKVKEETKMRSMWNFDNEIHRDPLDIDIKVHQGLLRICCQGVSPDTEPEESKASCLPAIML